MPVLLPPDRVIELLNEHLPHDGDAAWYVGSGIPQKKLRKAIKAYGAGVDAESVLALADGTVFGSAKEGILVTSEMLISGTSDGKFKVPLDAVTGAHSVGGWPEYTVCVVGIDGSKHNISTTCFDKKRDQLVNFFKALAHQPDDRAEAPPTIPMVPTAAVSSFAGETSIRAVNGGLRLMEVCQHEGIDDSTDLFDKALAGNIEAALLKGYCQYTGFNGRQVDGLFLVTNQRLLLFSLESGAKIVGVELTKRLLGAVPVPFFDDIVGFFAFTIPRSIYHALRGGRDKLIANALGIPHTKLSSTQPPLRQVQETRLSDLAGTVGEVSIGSGVWTGILSREFGVSFAPSQLSKTFSIPKDLILPEHETLEPFERLLAAIAEPLSQQGLSYRVDEKHERLTIVPAATAERKRAA